jgi:hypothetical protein
MNDEENIKTGVHLTKKGVENEFDVVFLNKGKLHTVECKTSIKDKDKNILTETIYKVVALQKELGLFARSYIVTLNDRNEEQVKENHVNRATKLFDISLITKEDILNCKNITELLKVN